MAAAHLITLPGTVCSINHPCMTIDSGQTTHTRPKHRASSKHQQTYVRMAHTSKALRLTGTDTTDKFQNMRPPESMENTCENEHCQVKSHTGSECVATSQCMQEHIWPAWYIFPLKCSHRACAKMNQ